MTSPSGPLSSRRTVLRGAALAGAAGLGATACTGGKETPKAPVTPTAPVDLGAPEEVPVGGARLYREERLLVSRSAQGEFKAFSAVCTHAGCVMTKVQSGEASCPCHGSKFDVNTGKVLRGPADAPLPDVPVKVAGGKLIAGPDA
ncbi:Rieske (2Fe-2S) protein [Streptomyces albireticuli]|uniref:Cytochrome bc1 complex Rieske iron-sulfur subunit n=1 Tax=Streptomyces albireticuli TaxID=1940 RepID=A0A2A2DDA3_9ACTN|nr:Rieske (2Fe-2S) protein [Streptomyces albireticuli]MCD9142265.1 Rieske (2Fe-2S) protein [Streptomyces albireticuli]MCD9162481.1 Rieske (2Fe-2S) protein [Streptomyces albireticuli]MCD9190439.1 Rieske (2Fe-2S) protein [Streptomyces albireticuli]PAU50433.1 FeS-binding protein [Streptomyces albireticuli]